MGFVGIVGLFLSLNTSCSRKKDTWSSRAYHQTTARYNGYFYAGESLKEGLAVLQSDYKENWNQILPVFIVGDDKESKNIYPQMDRTISKASMVIDRHSMIIKKKEENKWIKFNYLVIGKAFFYKKDYKEAYKVFDFIIKQYKNDPIKNEAIYWLARTKLDDDDESKALTLLKLLAEEPNISRELLSDYKASYADYYIRQEQYNKAIEKLDESILVTKNKKRKARLTYILAQLQYEDGFKSDAVASYKKVVKLHPDYEMVFYASINQAKAFRTRDGGGEEIRKLLLKMAKDRKNLEYRDQIYYALAEVEIEDDNMDKGIEYLELSVRTSLNNVEQKGISFMKLGDIYLNQREYELAKINFDSTLIFLPPEAPDYGKIEDLDEGLSSLIVDLNTIQLNDSLLHLASLTQKEQEKIILGLIVQKEKERDEELLAAQNLEKNKGRKLSPSVPLTAGRSNSSSNSKGDWYFYSPGIMSAGFSQFKQKWGSRKLKNDWRRSEAASNNTSLNPTELTIIDSSNVEETALQRAEIKSLEAYMAEIPMTEDQQSKASKKVEDALYDAGVIYNEKLEDVDNAIEMFDELAQRFPESQYIVTAYYQLYRLYVRKEMEGNYFGAGFRDNSDYYREIILNDYPYSQYAKIIRNPNYLKEAELALIRKQDDYKATYQNYKSHRYKIVLNDCNTVINEDPDNPYLPKYLLLKAMVVGSMSDKQNFERELQLLADNFSETEEGERAVEILNELNKGNLKAPGKKDQPKGKSTSKSSGEFDSLKKGEHFFALIYPNNKGNVNKVKIAISNFNKKYYSNDKLKVTNSFINKDNQIVIVRRFGEVDKAMSYYTNFINDDQQLKKVNEENYRIFLISSKNFSKLFKSGNIDGYDAFFQENYLK